MTDPLSPQREARTPGAGAGAGRPASSSRPTSSEHHTRLPAVRPSHSAGNNADTDPHDHFSPDRSASVGERRILNMEHDENEDEIHTLTSELDINNPFTLPREDVFSLRDRERASKQEERARLNSMKIWEKPARSGQVLDDDQHHQARSSYQERKSGRQQYMQATSKERIFQGRRREKENMADFIAKKRDMFLIQMSLDTKRQEIHKLEEKAQMKEDALKKSEMMLEEDAMRFDAFLKENDRKAHDALKRADQETKEKQEKVMEIKKLNQEISKVENEMSKYEEQLHACLKYKEFLDSLTPSEYLEELRKKKEERRRLKRESTGNTSRSTSKSSARSRTDEHTDEEEDGDEELEPMYFQRPEQLLEIFAQLEERNLFLIQNVQETEEALEELKQKFEDTEHQMEQKTDQLHENIADLKGKIGAENEKADALKKRTRASTIAGNQQKLLHGLSDKVREVYERCGFDPDTQTDTLDMLREIEGWLEYLLNEIKTMDPDKVELAEKKKNTERRNRIRKIKKEEQKRIYEERLAKSTARAKAEVVRRTGKQVMFRSPPIRKKKVQEATVQRDEEAEELKQFFT